VSHAVYAARRLVRSDVIKADTEEEKEGKSERIEREREGHPRSLLSHLPPAKQLFNGTIKY